MGRVDVCVGVWASLSTDHLLVCITVFVVFWLIFELTFGCSQAELDTKLGKNQGLNTSTIAELKKIYDPEGDYVYPTDRGIYSIWYLLRARDIILILPFASVLGSMTDLLPGVGTG